MNQGMDRKKIRVILALLKLKMQCSLKSAQLTMVSIHMSKDKSIEPSVN